MKTIYLVRHAKAVRNADIPDIDRTLEDRGREEARKVALKIKAGAVPDFLVSSPAARALETAEIFAAELGYPSDKIARRKALYDQNAHAFRSVLREMKDSCERVMLFGHNPSITDAARAFAPDIHDELPTAGLVTIVFDTSSWKEIAEGRGKLAGAEYPWKAAHPDSFKSMKKDLAEQLENKVASVLAGLNGAVANEMRTAISRAGEKIAGKFVKRIKAKEKQSKVQSHMPQDLNHKIEDKVEG